MKCSEQLAPSNLKALLIVFLLTVLLAEGRTVLILKKNVELDRGTVKIADIAEVQSDNEILKGFLNQITVIKGLKPGEKKVITRETLKAALSKNYISPDKVDIRGDRVVVYRRLFILDKKEVEKAVISYLKEKYPSVQVLSIRFNLERKVFNTPFRLEFQERSRTSSYIYLNIRVVHNGKVVENLNVSVRYREYVNAVVAKRNILKGSIISEGDITTRKVEKKSSLITDPSVVLGAVAKTNIPAGKTITMGMIQPDYPVKKRSYVKVIYDRNGIKIEITGIALENGQKGQTIKVKNPSTGKVIPCRVIGKDTVLFIGGM